MSPRRTWWLMTQNLNSEDRKQEIARLWQEHCSEPFPRGLAGIRINDIELVLLDSGISGCVSTFLGNGTLEPWKIALLGLAFKDLFVVLPAINKIGSIYFRLLGRLADLVLTEVFEQTRPRAENEPPY
jgi:hypothetical protein